MNTDWRPTASYETVKLRADLYKKIRNFFEEREVLEVETPLLGATGSLDLNILSIPAEVNYIASHPQTFYLQTSPEFALKRMLCAGFKSLYQLGKVFRNGERGPLHNPEFTMLEWYRLDFTYLDLMNEVEDLLKFILNISKVDRLSYEEAFKQYCNINPFDENLSLNNLKELASNHNIELSFDAQNNLSKDDWLSILLNQIIEPNLGFKNPVFLYDYPASQAALASTYNNRAQRFELYINGIELANGYNELRDADIQEQRFIEENQLRIKNNLPNIPVDNRLIEALKVGLPPCSGVALGIDRLLMVMGNKKDIQEVLTYTIEKA